MGPLRVAGLQLDLVWEDPAENHRRAATWIERAASTGAQLVALPEMFATGFSMNTGRLAEPLDGPSTEFLVDQAHQRNVWICGSIALHDGRPDPRPTNTLVLVSPTGERHVYAKRHPFTYADEDKHFRSGDSLLRVDVAGLRCAFFICYDLRFADDFWALAPDVDAYVVVANWPRPRRRHWQTLLLARAIENQAYVIGVNRVGVGGTLEYAGDSMIVDPWGEILVSAAETETMILADLDPARVRAARTTFPVLGDRRQPPQPTA